MGRSISMVKSVMMIIMMLMIMMIVIMNMIEWPWQHRLVPRMVGFRWTGAFLQ